MDIPQIAPIDDAALHNRLQARIDAKTKPLGALGRLEALALQVGLVLGTDAPQLRAPQMLVCAADHGLAARGVSAYPADVTWQMVRNFLQGGAAVSVLARQHGLALTVVDCGVAWPTPAQPGLAIHRIGAGTADSSQGPAMSADQCAQAIANGRELVRTLPGNALLLGEMGIGNSSAAAMLLARLSGQDIDACTGAGTGLDARGLAQKRKVLREVLALHARATAPLDALAAFGGFEIATLVGAVLQAAHERRVIVLDGFIASSAVLVAHALQPNVVQRCVAAHQSAEPGHALMLRVLGLKALLQLDLRLGEGSGAALAWPLLESACRILREMASFESAGVSGAA
ncbi:MAG: nicotinate-nucleotide--dimethylbenzimidazole phosphoribosyltransferase [Comamonadaceae bacterium]|nr:MAG: nicotinate-nucleotide--dimethylbenzimidazole phosphoribosyltransferase [Comamonadaceae bacterium]